ncbi:MAG: SO2930 family diheme c-type cytochrome [Pseudomonadota bacterium]
MHKLTFTALAVWLLTSCTPAASVQTFSADNYPAQLSAWRLLDAGLSINPDSVYYSLNTTLFSDYAHKLRTVYLPAGTSATYNEFESFEFPVGSVISKTFFYAEDATGRVILDSAWTGDTNNLPTGSRPLETRLLVRQQDGWDALPYIWRGNEAYLSLTGDLMQLTSSEDETFTYLVPSRNQCASCHATDHTEGAVKPIGMKARHLNRTQPGNNRNQLDLLAEQDWLDGLPAPEARPANANSLDLTDDPVELAHRARSYLDINCGHCHNPAGAADTSGLLLDYQDHNLAALGECKPPIAAGRGSGGRVYSIVPGHPDQSIMLFRLTSTDPAVMMPELGRSLAHTEGNALISGWINSLTGECR